MEIHARELRLVTIVSKLVNIFTYLVGTFSQPTDAGWGVVIIHLHPVEARHPSTFLSKGSVSEGSAASAFRGLHSLGKLGEKFPPFKQVVMFFP